MSDTNFTDGVTVIGSSWLNDVNKTVYRALASGGVAPTTPAQVANNLPVVQTLTMGANMNNTGTPTNPIINASGSPGPTGQPGASATTGSIMPAGALFSFTAAGLQADPTTTTQIDRWFDGISSSYYLTFKQDATNGNTFSTANKTLTLPVQSYMAPVNQTAISTTAVYTLAILFKLTTTPASNNDTVIAMNNFSLLVNTSGQLSGFFNGSGGSSFFPASPAFPSSPSGYVAIKIEANCTAGAVGNLSAGTAAVYMVGSSGTTTTSSTSLPLSTTTINVASTTGFPASGSVLIPGWPGVITYASLSGSTLVGCNGGPSTGTIPTGSTVNLASWGSSLTTPTGLGATVGAITTDLGLYLHANPGQGASATWSQGVNETGDFHFWPRLISTIEPDDSNLIQLLYGGVAQAPSVGSITGQIRSNMPLARQLAVASEPTYVNTEYLGGFDYATNVDNLARLQGWINQYGYLSLRASNVEATDGSKPGGYSQNSTVSIGISNTLWMPVFGGLRGDNSYIAATNTFPTTGWPTVLGLYTPNDNDWPFEGAANKSQLKGVQIVGPGSTTATIGFDSVYSTSGNTTTPATGTAQNIRVGTMANHFWEDIAAQGCGAAFRLAILQYGTLRKLLGFNSNIGFVHTESPTGGGETDMFEMQELHAHSCIYGHIFAADVYQGGIFAYRIKSAWAKNAQNTGYSLVNIAATVPPSLTARPVGVSNTSSVTIDGGSSEFNSSAYGEYDIYQTVTVPHVPSTSTSTIPTKAYSIPVCEVYIQTSWTLNLFNYAFETNGQNMSVILDGFQSRLNTDINPGLGNVDGYSVAARGPTCAVYFQSIATQPGCSIVENVSGWPYQVITPIEAGSEFPARCTVMSGFGGMQAVDGANAKLEIGNVLNASHVTRTPDWSNSTGGMTVVASVSDPASPDFGGETGQNVSSFQFPASGVGAAAVSKWLMGFASAASASADSMLGYTAIELYTASGTVSAPTRLIPYLQNGASVFYGGCNPIYNQGTVVSVSSPPASGAAWTNPAGFPIEVTISASGSITDVSVTSRAHVGSGAGTYNVFTGYTITVTYTGTLTMSYTASIPMAIRLWPGQWMPMVIYHSGIKADVQLAFQLNGTQASQRIYTRKLAHSRVNQYETARMGRVISNRLWIQQ